MTRSEKYQAVLIATACHIAAHFCNDDKVSEDLKKVGDKTLRGMSEEERTEFFQRASENNPALWEFIQEGTNCLMLESIFTVGEAVKKAPLEIVGVVAEHMMGPGSVDPIIELGISMATKDGKNVFIVPPNDKPYLN